MSGPTDASAEAFPIGNVQLDDDATECLELAAWIGALSSDDYLRSFTSILIALLHAPNAWSRWLLRYARAAGIELDRIYDARQFRPHLLVQIKERRMRKETPSGKPAWTSSAVSLASGAAELRGLSCGDPVGVRHLIGAYFYHLPTAHQHQMADWKFDGHRDGSAFLRQMRTRHPSDLDSWIAVHKAMLGSPPDLEGADPLPPPRVSGFAADSPEGDDQLDIEDDVYALSALICSRRVSPPLSVGLFGDWGSGKTFFIRQLQKGVSWISTQARGSDKMQKDLPFYKHVIQIEFNAWNYSEGNLWAALVQHILENLRLSDKEPEDLVAKRRAYLQGQMLLERQVREDATAKQKGAQQKVVDATEALTNLRAQHEKDVNDLKKCIATDLLETVKLEPASVEQINALREQLGLPAVAESAGEFLSALQETRSVLQRASAIFERVPPNQRMRFLIGSALVVILPPVVTILVGATAGLFSPHAATMASFAGWLSTTLATGTAWLRDRTRTLNDQIAQVEKLQTHARQRVEAAEQVHKAEAAQLEQRIALAKDEILAAQARQQEAQARVDAIAAQLATTTPASVLADFVRERAMSEDYRKHLGLPAVIRRDFDRISQMIKQENFDLDGYTDPKQEVTNRDRRINRIVLYIDDLDRCPEQLVVEVLKAVHLLLAFPLFVVVVAVDARWVSASLEQRFPGLLTAGSDGKTAAIESIAAAHARPSDYLEKIFQIPFWLRHPSVESVKRLVRDLVREGVGATAPPAPEKEPPPGQEQSAEGQAAVFKKRQHDPHASLLDVTPAELEYIEQLAPLLDRSPRALKRFVNVYRLVKASLPPEEQDTFLEDDSLLGTEFKVVLLLLAIVNGLPDVSDAIFDRLTTRVPAAKLGESFAEGPEEGETLRVQRRRLTDWLDVHVGANWKDADPARLIAWVPRVGRYSYHFHCQQL